MKHQRQAATSGDDDTTSVVWKHQDVKRCWTEVRRVRADLKTHPQKPERRITQNSLSSESDRNDFLSSVCDVTGEKKDSAGQTICDEWSFPRITSNTCFIFQELTFNVIISFSSLFFVLTGSFLFLFVKQLHHILKTTRGALHLLLKPVLLTEKWASLKTKVNKYDETKSSTNTLCPLMWRNNQIKKNTVFSDQ